MEHYDVLWHMGYNLCVEIFEYAKDDYGYWQYRKYRRVMVFHLNLHQSHLETSTIIIGATKAFGARVTKWYNIHSSLILYFTPELLDQSGYSRLIRIGDDFFGVCDEQEKTGYSRRKIKTYFLRYLEHRKSGMIDILLQ